jgi:hypothetical protein
VEKIKRLAAYAFTLAGRLFFAGGESEFPQSSIRWVIKARGNDIYQIPSDNYA